MSIYFRDTAKMEELKAMQRETLNILGFMTSSPSKPYETLYALLPEGIAYSRKATTPNNHFACIGNEWQEIERIPDNAEFIGHYRRLTR